MDKAGRYLASLPERVGRAGVALTGGAVYEVSQVALPRIVRGSRLYQATVARLLRILVELVGGVDGVYPQDAMPVRELTARKAAGNVVEFASILAVGWSPLWWLAAASDVAGGSRAYLKALVGELEEAGLLAKGTDVSSYEELLSKLETGSGVLADAIDVPPIKVEDARASWQTLQGQAENLPSADDLGSLFAALQEAAKREGRSVGELSAAVGLAAARAGVELGNVHVFDYYADAVEAIREEGLLRFLGRVTRPYARSTRRHFDPTERTYTDRLLDWVGEKRRERDEGHDEGQGARGTEKEAAGAGAAGGGTAAGGVQPPAAGEEEARVGG